MKKIPIISNLISLIVNVPTEEERKGINIKLRSNPHAWHLKALSDAVISSSSIWAVKSVCAAEATISDAGSGSIECLRHVFASNIRPAGPRRNIFSMLVNLWWAAVCVLYATVDSLVSTAYHAHTINGRHDKLTWINGWMDANRIYGFLDKYPDTQYILY